MLQEAVNLGCNRVDFAVLNWNPAQEFYAKKGANNLTKLEGWDHYRLSDEELREFASSHY